MQMSQQHHGQKYQRDVICLVCSIFSFIFLLSWFYFATVIGECWACLNHDSRMQELVFFLLKLDRPFFSILHVNSRNMIIHDVLLVTMQNFVTE
jgi:hypothetical protein